MITVFETLLGFALFKVLNEGKLTEPQDLLDAFSSPDSARKAVELKEFYKFKSPDEALSETNQLIDGKLSDCLSTLLLAHCDDGERLAVFDSRLGPAIQRELKIVVVYGLEVGLLMRGLRRYLTELIPDLATQNSTSMSLELSLSLARYKLTVSRNKLIVEANGLLDDIDEELDTCAMYVREWYGWHFPELAQIVPDNILYAKTVKLMSNRVNAKMLDFSEILTGEAETELKKASMISMGTEVSELDLIKIKDLCDQVLSLSKYRAQLHDKLKNRTNTIAPNLTAFVGGQVGARFIARGGNLLTLAKKHKKRAAGAMITSAKAYNLSVEKNDAGAQTPGVDREKKKVKTEPEKVEGVSEKKNNAEAKTPGADREKEKKNKEKVE